MPGALKIWAAAIAATLAASAARADGPATYYPSLGYGQRPPVREAWRAPPAPQQQPYTDEARDWTADQGERLPDSFFADAGGVGPDFPAAYTGGWYVHGYTVSGARAFAHSKARMSVRIHTHGKACNCR